MGESDLHVGRLELASRALDLTTALLKATSSSNFLLKGAWEIGQWLGRERLNQHELLDFMEKAKGLMFANRNGLRFFDQVIYGTDILPVGPLFLRQSGSLGRLMAGDPNLSWIVSTVAGLFQHHRDDRLVTEKLTAVIIGAHRVQREEDDISIFDALTHNPEHTRVRAVARKIVSSVWYNVVNAGCDTISLPQVLLNLCPKGHYLDPGDFGIVINNIHARCRSKAVLRTDHLLRDVLLWLLLHYDGTIVVNVGGHIVYTADLGSQHRELEVCIPSACSEAGSCGTAGQESYKILHHTSGRFEELLSGASFWEFGDLPQRPGVRQKLYDVPRPYPADSALWNKGLQILVKCSAQSVMRWLLGVPLSAQSDFESLGFSAGLGPGQRAAAHGTTISMVLKRIPAMVNLQWGSLPASEGIITDPSVSSSPGNYESPLTTERRLLILLECFPVLADLVRRASVECLCPGCSGRIQDLWGLGATNSALQAGCMKRTALDEALLLLAHGITDGFGVNDVSSISETGPIVEGMAVLLVELISERKVCWDTWFMVASCVYLGCPFEKPDRESDDPFGGTSFAAIQFGNLATSAPWLDLTKELTVQGCFSLIGSNGRLGVITESDRQQMQFRTIEENFAIIQTELTEDTTSFSSGYPKAASTIDHRFLLDEDESAVESDVILCQPDDRFYRLLLRIKTKNHRRIVDPSDALSAVIRMLPSARCHHGVHPPEMSPSTAKVYTMDEVVGRWPDNFQRNNADTYHTTNILNTHLKHNVALALSVNPIAVLNFPELACLTCTLRHAKDLGRKPLRKGEGGTPGHRFVINLKTQLTGHRGTLQLCSSATQLALE